VDVESHSADDPRRHLNGWYEVVAHCAIGDRWNCYRLFFSDVGQHDAGKSDSAQVVNTRNERDLIHAKGT
jgi:hypothetical protein